MLVDLKPLFRYRDYRYLFLGQSISYLGSMVSYVAVPYQVYQLTHSSMLVGLLGTVQLVPLVLFGLWGGAVADSMDRRKLLVVAEIVMSLCALGLALNAYSAAPKVWILFAITAVMQAANGFHRPAMDAIGQKLVQPADYPSIAALGSLKSGVGAVAGPALGGALIAWAGTGIAFLIDFATFFLSTLCLLAMSRIPAPEKQGTTAGNVVEGLKFAVKRPELMGTYIVDMVAMTFAFPTALFPAMGEKWGGATATGALYSAMSVGALTLSLFSGWAKHVKRHGAFVIGGAAVWGIAIIAFGWVESFPLALFFLGLAGAADMVSGMFRGTIWNETIPNHMRGRLAGIEMISYMSGPLVGNARAGWMAALMTPAASVMWGGVLCVAGVGICAAALPRFRNYVSTVTRES